MTTTTRNTLGPAPTNREAALASAEALYDNATTLVAILEFWTLAGRLPINDQERALIEHNIINARSSLEQIERSVQPTVEDNPL